MLLELIIYPLCLLSFCLLMTKKWGIINQRASLTDNYEQIALLHCIKTQPFAISLGLIAISDNLFVVAIIALILPVFILLSPIIARHDENSLLLVETHWLHPNKARIHLTKTDQTFNRETFIELLQLIEPLKRKGITDLHLSSPLFTKGQSQRKMPRFIAQLEKQGITVQSQPTHCTQFPMAMFILGYLKYVKKSSSLKNTSITHWQTYTLRF